MKWSVKKCAVLDGNARLSLCAERLPAFQSVAYLGVTWAASGVSAKRLICRISAARVRLFRIITAVKRWRTAFPQLRAMVKPMIFPPIAFTLSTFNRCLKAWCDMFTSLKALLVTFALDHRLPNHRKYRGLLLAGILHVDFWRRLQPMKAVSHHQLRHIISPTDSANRALEIICNTDITRPFLQLNPLPRTFESIKEWINRHNTRIQRRMYTTGNDGYRRKLPELRKLQLPPIFLSKLSPIRYLKAKDYFSTWTRLMLEMKTANQTRLKDDKSYKNRWSIRQKKRILKVSFLDFRIFLNNCIDTVKHQILCTNLSVFWQSYLISKYELLYSDPDQSDLVLIMYDSSAFWCMYLQSVHTVA